MPPIMFAVFWIFSRGSTSGGVESRKNSAFIYQYIRKHTQTDNKTLNRKLFDAMVNYIKHMRGSWQRYHNDRRLTSVHKILYFCLFENWNRNRFRNPISINREEIMWDTSINSSKLYYKCMKDLHDWGYIQYKPSNNVYVGSKVLLRRYDLTEDPTEDLTDSPAEYMTENVQGARSINSINNTNNLNNVNGRNVLNASNENGSPEQAEEKDVFENKNPNTADASEKSPSEMKKITEGAGAAADVPDSVEEVIEFFLGELDDLDDEDYESEADKYKIEAAKFFNYYESIGWVLSGQTPIKNWHATARSWILRMPEFEKPVRMPVGKKQSATKKKKKNYAEPF